MTQSMTHANNIFIPARFRFRPFGARWEICGAEILGWWEEPILGIAAPGKRMPVLGTHPPDREALRVRIEVPTGEMQDGAHVLDLMGIYGIGLHPSYILKMDRADIPPGVLSSHENPDVSPDIAGREFTVLAYPNHGFGRLFPSVVKPGEIEKSAWAMRDEFFGLEEDDWTLSRFLNRWGIWNYRRGYEAGMGGAAQPFVLSFPHRIWEQRENFRKALAGSARTWLRTASPLTFSTVDEQPYFLVERFYCEDAIKATITIHHLAEVKFGICKRSDCRKLFERATKHKRLYCSPECAHLANVRKLRAEARKKDTNLKGAKQNAKG
jgi:hypothetical protein